MKKILFSATFLMAFGFAKAQTIYTENFEGTLGANQLPTGWTETGVSSDGIYMVGTNVNANAGGFWPVPAHTKFAMTNDDVCNCNKSADRLIAPAFNFSAIPVGASLTMNFAAVMDNYYGGAATVEVSTNGGGTWTPVYNIPATSNTNAWQNLSVNLNAYVGNPNVMISFLYNDQAQWATGLAIDDVTVVQGPGSVDLAISAAKREYILIPVTQRFSMPLEATLRNNGTFLFTDAVLTVNVYQAPDFVNPVFTSTSGTNSVAVSGTTVVNVGSYTPPTYGTYVFEYSVNSATLSPTDVNPANDETFYVFAVDSTEFSRDNGTGDQSIGAGTNNNAIIGSNFNLTNNGILKEVLFAAGGLVAGNQANVKIYNTNGAGMPTTLVTTLNFTAPNAGPLFTVPAANLQLPAGNYFFGVEEVNSINNYGLYLADTIYTPNTTWYTFNGSPFATLASAGFPLSPIIRPVLVDCSTLNSAPVANDVSCFGLNNGSITLNPTGGTQPYTVSWSGPSGFSSSSQNITGLIPGSYSVLITDADGCSKTTSHLISEPTALSLTLGSFMDPTSCGGLDGVIDVNVSGGTTPYGFSWNSGQTTEDLNGVAAGNYTLTVTDANSCTVNLSQSLSDPNSPTVTLSSITNVLCNGASTGAININVVLNGGATSATTTWNNGATTEDISGIPAGNYSVTILDDNGCSASLNATITQPSPININSSVTGVQCNGGNTGAVNITVTGGTPGYFYDWDNDGFDDPEDISGVVAGSYTVQVMDFNACIQTATITISEPAAISLSTSVTNVMCTGQTNGAVNLTVTGGTPGFTFDWDNDGFDDTEDISGLAAGSYTVQVMDNNGCLESTSVTITEPASSLSVSSSVTNETAPNNGAIDITVTGGTPPYSYSWSNSATTQDLNGIAGGTYTVTVTDNNGCQQTLPVTVLSSVGIEELNGISFQVYPNPSNGVFVIEVTEFSSVMIYNAIGEQVYSSSMNAGINNIDMSSVSNGIYFIQVIQNEKVAQVKIIKQ